MITDPLFYAAAVPAVTLMGLAKGGFSGLGVMALPLMALVVSPVRGAAILLPILLVQDAVTVWAYRHTWDRRNLVVLLPSAAVGVGLGYLLAARVSEGAVSLAVGVISIAFALRRWQVERKAEPPKPASAGLARGWFWGAVSGFTSMIAHAGGPPFQIYVLPQRLPRDVFVGTSAVAFAAVNWMKVLPYLALGQFTPANLAVSTALLPVAVASTWGGVLLVRRFSAERLYTVIYGLLAAVGVKLVVDGWTKLAAAWP